VILTIVIGLGISYTLLFLLSVALKDNSIADVFWGMGFLQVAIHSFILYRGKDLSQVLFNILIMLWSLRISLYILTKKLSRRGEDPRYAKWRKEWKYFYLRSFFQVYLFQGFLLMVVATPIFLINSSDPGWGAVTILGLSIGIFGLVFETVADLQLKNFVKTKIKGQIMTKGLWRYSRHPNYFGESLFWLGASLVAAQVSIVAWISWILITLLLRFVSGVPLAEERYKENKSFQEYKRKTPPMFPNPFIR